MDVLWIMCSSRVNDDTHYSIPYTSGSSELLPKKYVHFFTDNIVQKPRLGQICHLFSRTLLSSKIVDIYIPFSKTEKSLREKEA